MLAFALHARLRSSVALAVAVAGASAGACAEGTDGPAPAANVAPPPCPRPGTVASFSGVMSGAASRLHFQEVRFFPDPAAAVVTLWSAPEDGGLLIGLTQAVRENLGEVRTYDVSRLRVPLTIGTECTASERSFEPPVCRNTRQALRGWFKVTEVSPTYRATFHLDHLWKSGFSEAVAGTVDGCIAAPHPAPEP